MLPARGDEFQSPFQLLARSAGADGSASLSGASRLDRCLMAGVQPNGMRPALLLWRDAQPAGNGRTHPLRTKAAAATGGVERRRNRTVPRSCAEFEAPH